MSKIVRSGSQHVWVLGEGLCPGYVLLWSFPGVRTQKERTCVSSSFIRGLTPSLQPPPHDLI